MEPEHFFHARPQNRFFVEVDLFRDLKETIGIQIGGQCYSQQVLYLNIPNTCYWCQSYEHKIRDYLLVVSRVKLHLRSLPLYAPLRLLRMRMDGLQWFAKEIVLRLLLRSSLLLLLCSCNHKSQLSCCRNPQLNHSCKLFQTLVLRGKVWLLRVFSILCGFAILT